MSNQKLQVVEIKRHSYAPELTRAKLSNGKWFKAPSCQTIAEAQSAFEEMNKPKPLYGVMNSDGSFQYTHQHPHIRMYG